MPIQKEREAVQRGGDAAAGHIPAGTLSTAHIGQIVEFYWNYPTSGVLAHVAGELRQIAHDGNGTHINLTSAVEPTGALDEFSLDHDAPIYVVL